MKSHPRTLAHVTPILPLLGALARLYRPAAFRKLALLSDQFCKCLRGNGLQEAPKVADRHYAQSPNGGRFVL